MRRAFFSFHYQRDIFRANQVRNSWVCPPEREYQASWDGSLWEEAVTKGDDAIKSLIDSGLANTSVTVVLIGQETYLRKYVHYEIARSFQDSKGLVGVYIHNLNCPVEGTCIRGENPLDNWAVTKNNVSVKLSSTFKTYDYVEDDGYNNLGAWIEEAARIAGR
ncbi:MAG: hypothetical protein BGO01_00975 [Armatimonadetes bacterium 55-13]|nr:MAG: hypothetical protein BGO01_00975 [Armatimonadetes bacterium 55-13]